MKTNRAAGSLFGEIPTTPPRKYQNIPATSEAHRIIKAEAAQRGLLLKDFMTEIATRIMVENGAK